MVEILIDSQRCDIEADYALPKGIFRTDLSSLNRASKLRDGRSVEIRIPSSPTNDRIMCFATDPCSAERFNDRYHHAEVVVDGVVLFSGVVYLVGTVLEQGASSYLLRIRDGGGDWAEGAAQRELRETAVDYAATLDESSIAQSWEGEQMVRFLPVRYDDYTTPYNSTSLFPPQRLMSISDYHPFISAEKLLRAIFAEQGYSVESRFLESEEFRQLYISGCYPTTSRLTSQLKSAADFLAGRTEQSTTTADYSGRAWLTPLVLTSSLGNIVQTTRGDGYFDNGKCLKIDAEGVRYTPPVEMSVAFEIFLRYRTDYRITSHDGVQGFDSLYFDTGCDMRHNLSNLFPDRRDNAWAGIEYRCVIFDYDDEAIYRLLYTSDQGNGILSTFTVSSAYVSIPQGLTNVRCTLQRNIGNNDFINLTTEWALYDGYVEDEGEIEVELLLRTPPQLLSPNSSQDFSRMYLHGAAEGQKITLLEGCTLRPIFTSSPAIGSTLSFADVAAHPIRQIEFIEALQQMFNLQIVTDAEARKVYIEPYDQLFNGPIYDWSDKVELTGAIEVKGQDLALNKVRRLGYRNEGDGAVNRFNAQSEAKLGEWATSVDSYAAAQGVESHTNTLFCPTLNTAGIHASAPSASIMQVGDRDTDELESVSMRVVRYTGMRPLPDAEVWNFHTLQHSYPHAAFHSAGEFTLCFEDRDGCVGLHRYYDQQWQAQALRELLTVDIRLAPHQLVSLIDPTGDGPNLRSRFRLNITGQGALYRLLAIEGYDAQRGVARVRFARTLND